ncbi:coatomer subunit gamma [Plasmodium gonderi]|uniref:Coatomer subunit gamma n=1 Tax=Plasmodium gonderi TaxID=77519 RepID=A0A1Y1JK96_PLAGO|nr:coatomer subunit gamma [Plasmodium gonderi]GAW81212.1 coatomer subunit gamma [Plasmodium gonderi]
MLKPIGIKDKIQRNLLKDAKYDDEKSSVNPHEGDKASILQETRVFSSYPLNTQKCMQILTKILYLINKGEENLTSQECTDIFFSITKLFQSNNERLRRMVYLLIKSLPVNEKEVFIVTSSLTKDMNSANDCYRANAIRVLSKIIDYSMAAQIERYLKTAIVDKNSFVSCSSLLCGLNLYFNASCDIVKKWIHEVTECINSKNSMIQFHALTLLCSIKYQDKLALEKIISSYNKTTSNLSGSLANCLLIKYASYLIYTTEMESELGNFKKNTTCPSTNAVTNQMGSYIGAYYSSSSSSPSNVMSHTRTQDIYNIQDYPTNKGNFLIHPTTKVCFDYLKNCLKSKDPMILFECIKCIFELIEHDKGAKNSTTVFNVDILNECMKVCQLFLLSSKVVDKFSIIRQINKLAHYRPQVASKINQDIENLLTDSNKSICVLAFTTLLKTGNESNIDQLLGQINNYMSGDNTFFKMQIIEELKNLCFIYPTKCNIILDFLANNLRDEESYQFKSNTIDAIVLIITQIPNSEETAILQLCEFIEDCEYNSLLLRVIRFLLVHIPKTKNPSKYIRYIYNRLILENSTIRVDGMHALFYIALKCGNNSKDILFLLNCLLADNDDEVRDRTNFFYHILKEKIKHLELQSKKADEIINNNNIQQHPHRHDGINSEEVSSNIDINTNQSKNTDSPTNAPLIDELLTNEKPAHIENILHLIKNHIENNITEEFDYEHAKEEIKKLGDNNTFNDAVSSPASSTFLNRKGSSAELYTNNTLNGTKLPEQNLDYMFLENISAFIEKYNMGTLKIVGKSIALTESEAEYTVFAKKYIYDNHILLEFTIQNTLSEHILSDITLQINSYDNKWSILEKTTIQNLYFNAPQNLYVLLERNNITHTAEVQSNSNNYIVNQTFQLSLYFLTKENEIDDGFPDSYSINPLSIQITDFISPRILRTGEFKHLWDTMENSNSESVSKFSLNFENIQLAVVGLLNTLNMMACEETDVVEANTTNHNMLLSAKFCNESNILCKASLILSQQYGCLLKIVCRSCHKQLSDTVLKSLE